MLFPEDNFTNQCEYHSEKDSTTEKLNGKILAGACAILMTSTLFITSYMQTTTHQNPIYLSFGSTLFACGFTIVGLSRFKGRNALESIALPPSVRSL
jgi:hypothetical protein